MSILSCEYIVIQLPSEPLGSPAFCPHPPALAIPVPALFQSDGAPHDPRGPHQILQLPVQVPQIVRQFLGFHAVVSKNLPIQLRDIGAEHVPKECRSFCHRRGHLIRGAAPRSKPPSYCTVPAHIHLPVRDHNGECCFCEGEHGRARPGAGAVHH